MASAQDRVFGTPELVIHILRRVHGGFPTTVDYRRSDLLRLWHARRVSRLFYDCVLETFLQKHIYWTSIILELGQFKTEEDVSDEDSNFRWIDDESYENCFSVDDSLGESEKDYIYGDEATGRFTLEYVFDRWAAEDIDVNDCHTEPKRRAIFRPLESENVPYDIFVLKIGIMDFMEKKPLYSHSSVVLWDIAHDMELPGLALVNEDGGISFDWYAMLRDFFCLEREVCRLRTRKVW